MPRPSAVVAQAPEFNYALLDPKAAAQARAAAQRVRETIHRGISVIIEVGQSLIEVKQHLSHGQFGQWLSLEFGWTRRSAENYMNVAMQFGPKSEMISHLDIPPTSAYLLAAPSTPSEAREEAIQLAQSGKRLTPIVVRAIVTKHRKRAKRTKSNSPPMARLEAQLNLLLRRIRDRWEPRDLSKLAGALRKFADGLA